VRSPSGKGEGGTLRICSPQGGREEWNSLELEKRRGGSMGDASFRPPQERKGRTRKRLSRIRMEPKEENPFKRHRRTPSLVEDERLGENVLD